MYRHLMWCSFFFAICVTHIHGFQEAASDDKKDDVKAKKKKKKKETTEATPAGKVRK